MISQNKSSRDAACPTTPGEGSSETEAENGRNRGCPATREQATPTVSTECKLLLKGNFLEAVILTGINFAVAEWELSHVASI